MGSVVSFGLRHPPRGVGTGPVRGVGTRCRAAGHRAVRSPGDNPAQRQAQRILAEANRWTDSLAAALLQPGTGGSPWSVWIGGLEQLANGLQSRRMVTDNGRMGFVLLRIKTDETDFVRGRTAIHRLRQIVDEVRIRHPDVKLGITGMPVLESDEMETSQRDSVRSTLIGMVGVILVLLAGMGGWRGPLLAMLTLLLAMTWSLGFTTLAVGHLNILSMSFGAILVGLGIDFGIHFFTRYDQARQSCSDGDEALRETARSVGPGISTGAITTALAFLTASLTHFRGVAELGIIAGGGIVLCLVAAMVVMPALLKLGDRRASGGRRRHEVPVALLCQPFLRHPYLSCALALVTTVGRGRGPATFAIRPQPAEPAAAGSGERGSRTQTDRGPGPQRLVCALHRLQSHAIGGVEAPF